MSEEKIVVHIDIDLKDLIPGFLDNRRNDLQRLMHALQENDLVTLRSIGHNLKGVGGGYGFLGITDIGTALEDSAKSNNLETANENIKKLSHYLSHIEVSYVEG